MAKTEQSIPFFACASPIPKIIPINELKNTANISKLCRESSEPIVVTKNGYADIIMMNPEYYEKTLMTSYINNLLDEGLEDIEKGNVIDYETFLKELNERYGGKI